MTRTGFRKLVFLLHSPPLPPPSPCFWSRIILPLRNIPPPRKAKSPTNSFAFSPLFSSSRLRRSGRGWWARDWMAGDGKRIWWRGWRGSLRGNEKLKGKGRLGGVLYIYPPIFVFLLWLRIRDEALWVGGVELGKKFWEFYFF